MIGSLQVRNFTRVILTLFGGKCSIWWHPFYSQCKLVQVLKLACYSLVTTFNVACFHCRSYPLLLLQSITGCNCSDDLVAIKPGSLIGCDEICMSACGMVPEWIEILFVDIKLYCNRALNYTRESSVISKVRNCVDSKMLPTVERCWWHFSSATSCLLMIISRHNVAFKTKTSILELMEWRKLLQFSLACFIHS